MFLIAKLRAELKIGFKGIKYMQNRTQNQSPSVEKDCALILDAVRRLKEATWNLCDEDSDWADHLLPKIKEALTDHIEYENACIFPDLSRDLAQQHFTEHQRILALLGALDGARQKTNAGHFKALLDLLIEELDRHHHRSACRTTGAGECSNQSVRQAIESRAEGSSLEDK